MGVGGVIRRLQVLSTLRDLRHPFNGIALQSSAPFDGTLPSSDRESRSSLAEGSRWYEPSPRVGLVPARTGPPFGPPL